MHNPIFDEAIMLAGSFDSVYQGGCQGPALYSMHELEDAEFQNVNVVKRALRYSLAGCALYQYVAAQLPGALGAIAAPGNLNWTRLLAGAVAGTPRKPRIKLWGELNSRGTLEILWAPLPDVGPEGGTDYRRLQQLNTSLYVRSHVVLRFLDGEFVRLASERESRPYGRDSSVWLQQALEYSLLSFLQALSAVCDAVVGDWPVYDDDRNLIIKSVHDRAFEALRDRAGPLQSKVNETDAGIAAQLVKIGLSLPVYQRLQAKSVATGEKVTALVFAETGKRCSSLTTRKLDELLAHQAKLAVAREHFGDAFAKLVRAP